MKFSPNTCYIPKESRCRCSQCHSSTFTFSEVGSPPEFQPWIKSLERGVHFAEKLPVEKNKATAIMAVLYQMYIL